MPRRILLTIIYFTFIVPFVVGSATLVPKLSTASCSGHFKNVSVTSVTCDYSNFGCTYGSEVFVTGEVTSDKDLPRPMVIKMSLSFPSFYKIGTNVYDSEVYDICEDGVVTPPDGDDSEYNCPSAGLYKFHFVFQNFGNSQKWYAGWHGFSTGFLVHFKHEGGGKDYATCSIDVKLEGNQDENVATNAVLVSFAMLGLAGIFTGIFVRRRKETLANINHGNYDDSNIELGTNFEIVQDHSPTFV